MNKERLPLGPAPTAVEPGPAVLTPQQDAALRLLRAADAGLRVDQVARGLELHPNTAREHLDALVGAGVAERRPEASGGRGRPAWRYAALPDAADTALRAYTGLALALAGHLRGSTDDPTGQARELGRQWGRELAAAHTAHDDDVRAQIIAHLQELGFSPKDDGAVIALTRCPLLDAARRYPDVTCQVHRGLISGALETFGAPQVRVDLAAFAAPGHCALRLTEPEPGDRAPDGPGPDDRRPQ